MSRLLCLFSKKKDIDYNIEYIFTKFDPIRIFIYEYQNDVNKVFCTFSYPNQYDLDNNIIVVHRKSETNTLYTINAINELIIKMNNGILDKSYSLPWHIYTDHLLLINNYIKFNFLKKITN